MHSILDTQAIATTELLTHLEKQVQSVAPEIQSIVNARIQIDRVGLTKNASNTPYIVYTIGDRRCCIFFKRKLLWQMMQALLKLEFGIESKIRNIIAKDKSELLLMIGEEWQHILNRQACRFIERCNNRQTLEPKQTKTPAGYQVYARGYKACAKNSQIFQQHNMEQTEELYAAMKEAIASWDMSILATKLETHAQYKKAAWMQATVEEKELLRILAENKVKVGSMVTWDCHATVTYLEQWMPFRVGSISNGKANLDFLSTPISIEKLKVVA